MNPRVGEVTPTSDYKLKLVFTNGDDCSGLLDFGVLCCRLFGMKFIKYILIAVFLSSMTSCSYSGSESLVPQDEVEFAKNYLAQLQHRNFDEVEKYLNPQLKTPDVRRNLEKLAGYFPSEEPLAIELISSSTLTNDDSWGAILTFQYQFSDAWLVAHVVMEKRDGKIIVHTVHVEQKRDSLEKINAFNLSGKSVTHYFFLALTIIIPLFILYTVVLCARTPIEKAKWLWVVCILFGVAGITLNWTTGEMDGQILSIHLMGAGAIISNKYAPWFITVSFPLGAVLFLVRKKRMTSRTT